MSSQPHTDSPKLFRQEALESRRVLGFGQIILIRPPSLLLMTMLAVCLGLALLALLIFGSYTRRTPVTGQLITQEGIARIYPAQTGQVSRKYIQEGQYVHKGAVLYELSSDRSSGQGQAVQAQISQHVQDRKQTLAVEIAATQQTQRDEYRTQQMRVQAVEQDIHQLQALIASQQNRQALSKSTVQRYEELYQQGYLAQEQVQQQQALWIDQHSRLQSLERDLAQRQKDLQQAQQELAALPERHQAAIAQLQRGLSSVSQELTESEARRGIFVLAPESGTITAVLADVGQMVDSSRPMVSIVPERSPLQAMLYVPSRAIGFIQAGQPVQIRYQAYPYQKFGFGRGRVLSVARIALSPQELSAQGLGLSPQVLASQEPVYPIRVQLDAQTIQAYGQAQPLQAGMLIDADILQERRRLYEWMLEPLYTVSGQI